MIFCFYNTFDCPVIGYPIEWSNRHPNQLDLGPHNANRAFPRSMARENTVLHCLVLHDQKEMYRTLVDEYGANPWAPNIHGDTPLLLACRRSLEMAQVIILES